MAEENEKKDYGKKIEYDPLWKGPMNIKRSRTDSNALIAFTFFIILWNAISTYALVTGKLYLVVSTGRSNFDNYDYQDFHHDSNLSEDNLIASTKTALFIAKITIGFSIFAGVLTIIFIVLLRWFAKVMVYTSIVLISTTLLAIIIYAGVNFSSSRSDERSNILTVIIVCSITLLVVIGCTIWFHKKINIACEVIREASKAVIFIPSSLVFPILPVFLQSLITIYWFIVGVYLLSLGEFTNHGWQGPPHLYFLLIFHFFGFCWLSGFISGFSDMTLSGSFATWYWTSHKAYVPKSTILHFMSTTAKYHLGTIAFGSLLIAICQLINALLSWIRSKLQSRGNAFTCCCFGWYQFMFENLEEFVKFMSRGAYVMSSMHGTDFKQSTKDAFNLFMRNILKVIVANKVTDGILYLGFFVSVGLSMLCTWGYCSESRELNEAMIPSMIGVLILSSIISGAFLAVLQSAVNTIFLCVLEDYERNDGSKEKPYFMTSKLQSLLFKELCESV